MPIAKTMSMSTRKKSEKIARRLVERYLQAMGGEWAGHIVAEAEEALIASITSELERARPSPESRRARSAARRATTLARAGGLPYPLMTLRTKKVGRSSRRRSSLRLVA